MSKIKALADWQSHPILTRPDNSYVITHKGYPYHVPNASEPGCEEFTELWADVDAFAKANSAQVQPEPGPPAPTPEELTAMRIFEIKTELSALDTKSARPLRAIAAGTPTDADRATLAELETQAEGLRTELAGLKAPTTV